MYTAGVVSNISLPRACVSGPGYIHVVGFRRQAFIHWDDRALPSIFMCIEGKLFYLSFIFFSR